VRNFTAAASRFLLPSAVTACDSSPKKLHRGAGYQGRRQYEAETQKRQGQNGKAGLARGLERAGAELIRPVLSTSVFAFRKPISEMRVRRPGKLAACSVLVATSKRSMELVHIR